MPSGLTILVWALNGASLLLLAYWSAGLVRLVRTARAAPSAREGLASAERDPARESVCVVVPAHNEQDVIGGLIASLRAQDHPALSVVLCLDRCTDRTAAAARAAIGGDPRFEIVEIGECPSDWSGKVHAVWRGVTASGGAGADVLVFADADTVFDPSCVRATLALLRDRSLDLLSLLSSLTVTRWFEALAQPAATIEMVTQYPILRAGRREGRRAFANGQFMMFRREAYEAVGGHRSVKDELLEDMALARRIAEAGRPAGVAVADGLLMCRMYASWAEFRRGWKRIYTELARRRPGRMERAAARVLLFGVALPSAAAAAAVVTSVVWHPAGAAVGLAALAVFAVVLGLAYRSSRAPAALIPGYLMGAAVVAWLLLAAARDLRRGRAIEWAGRKYVRPVR